MSRSVSGSVTATGMYDFIRIYFTSTDGTVLTKYSNIFVCFTAWTHIN